jgi:hypothetical protein
MRTISSTDGRDATLRQSHHHISTTIPPFSSIPVRLEVRPRKVNPDYRKQISIINDKVWQAGDYASLVGTICGKGFFARCPFSPHKRRIEYSLRGYCIAPAEPGQRADAGGDLEQH